MLEAAGLATYVTADHELHQRVDAVVREELGEQAWNEAREEGRVVSFEQAVEYAIGKTDADVSPFA